MSSEQLVSVIIPTFNRADTVSRAIDSVLNQTYCSVEVIVVNDGSTDHTENVLKTYGNRIRVVSQSNAGPAVARNRGAAAASGEVIAFLDSDDAWVPGKLARQMELLAIVGPTVPCCLCNCSVLHGGIKRTSTFKIADTLSACSPGLWVNVAEVIFSRFVLFTQAAAIRREVLDRIGYFDETLRFGEDYDLPLRLALEGPWVLVQEELVMYHTASANSWADKAKREEVRLCQDLLRIRERMLNAVHQKPTCAELQKLADREFRRAKRALRIAELKNQRGALQTAFSRAFETAEGIRQGVFRRTPQYPRMNVVPLQQH